MPNIKDDFIVHPRKKVGCAPKLDYNGNPMPTTLGEVYGSYSQGKIAAYNYCRKLMYKYNGFNFCICSHNCMAFSVAFDFMHPETGEYMTARITRHYNHAYYC